MDNTAIAPRLRVFFAAVMAAVAVLALGAGIASAGSKKASKKRATASLVEMAERAPHIGMLGGWEITNAELTAEGGSTSFHYERDPVGARGVVDTTVEWYRGVSIETIGARLQAAGLTPAGTLPYSTMDEPSFREGRYDSVFTRGTAQAYTSPAGAGLVDAVGVWQQDGWTFTLSAQVQPDLYMQERLLERVSFLGPNEWAIAIQPGGQRWLREHFGEKVGAVEQVKVEGPDGTLVYEVRARKRSRG